MRYDVIFIRYKQLWLFLNFLDFLSMFNYMYVCSFMHMYWCPGRSHECIGSLGVGVTGVAGSVNHLAWVLGAKLSPLESGALSNH